jgi:hypothetical protein
MGTHNALKACPPASLPCCSHSFSKTACYLVAQAAHAEKMQAHGPQRQGVFGETRTHLEHPSFSSRVQSSRKPASLPWQPPRMRPKGTRPCMLGVLAPSTSCAAWRPPAPAPFLLQPKPGSGRGRGRREDSRQPMQPSTAFMPAAGSVEPGQWLQLAQLGRCPTHYPHMPCD